MSIFDIFTSKVPSKYGTFIAANGVSFSVSEIIRHVDTHCSVLTKVEREKKVSDMVRWLRTATVAECDQYARDTLGINTGNRYCS